MGYPALSPVENTHENPSPGIFPCLSPLFGFHRTAGWQNIFRIPCSQSLISASIPPGSLRWSFIFTGCIFGSFRNLPADRYSHLPYSCIGFPSIYNAEILFPENFPESPSRFNCNSPFARESTSFSHGYSFYIRPAYFSASFFLPDNDGSYPASIRL